MSWEYSPEPDEIKEVITALIASESAEWVKGSLSVAVQTEEHSPFMGDVTLKVNIRFTLYQDSNGQADFGLDTSSAEYVSFWKRLFG